MSPGGAGTNLASELHIEAGTDRLECGIAEMSREGHRLIGLRRDQQVVIPEVHVEIFHLQRHRPVEEGVVT
jgi:hypothetical protein